MSDRQPNGGSRVTSDTEEEQVVVRVELCYTVDEMGKNEAAAQASKLASEIEDDRVGGFSVGTRYVETETQQ